nr:hypothetical protein GCM10025730_37500 [Promicromonospora thailandica]
MTIDSRAPSDLEDVHADLGEPAAGPRRRTGPAARWQDVLVLRAVVMDLGAVMVAVALGYVLRFDRSTEVQLFEPRGGQYVLISVVLAEAWVLAIGLSGGRSPGCSAPAGRSTSGWSGRPSGSSGSPRSSAT